MRRRLFQEHWKPRSETSPVSFEQRSPANHINFPTFAGEKFLDSRIPHKPVRLSEIWQHADRSAGCPAQEPSNLEAQYVSSFRRSDSSGVISVGLQAIKQSTMGANRWRHHFRMTAASDVRFRVTSELENDLHRVFVYRKGFDMQRIGCIIMITQDGQNLQSPSR